MQSHKIKVMVGFRNRLPSDSSSSSTPCHQPAELDFYRFSSALLPHPDQCQHDTTAVPPASPPCDRDDLTAFSLSAPLRPSHRQLLHIPLSRKRTPCLPPQRKVRLHVKEDVWQTIHLHSGQQHRHHAADGDLAAPCRWRGQDRRSGSAWVLGPLLPPFCRGVRRQRHHCPAVNNNGNNVIVYCDVVNVQPLF